MTSLEVLREDYTLDADQRALRESFTGFLTQHCPLALARAAGPGGFDPGLWRRLCDFGAVGIAVPVTAGGAGGSLVDVALVVEELGRRLGPVPLTEAVVAARLLAGPAGAGHSALLAALLEGSTLPGLALAPVQNDTPQLVAGGARADWILAERAGELVRFDHPKNKPSDDGSDWLTLQCSTAPEIIAEGQPAVDALVRMRREWTLLTAAALIGLAQAVLDLTVRYASERYAFDAPIGTFQAVSHPLADSAIAIAGGRRLVHKAAWHAERDRAQTLTTAALLHARRTADRAVALGVHVHGGIGLSLESDVQLYFTRAKLWPAPAGDPQRAVAGLADELWGGTR